MRRIFAMLFGFALPGMAAGWLLSGGVLRLGGDLELAGAVFAAFALAGALAGRWAVRGRSMLGAGMLLLMLSPVFSMRLLLPAVSFAFGVFAVRPIRPECRNHFQCGALAATVAGVLAGGYVLPHPLPLRLALALVVPAAAMLAAADRKHKRLVLSAGLLLGAGIVFLPWRTPDRSAERTHDLRMLVRHHPDLRLLALEPGAPMLRALVVVEFPSTAADSLRTLHWVAQADTLDLSEQPFPPTHGRLFARVGDLDRELREKPEKRYDLIYVLDPPSAPAPAQARFVRRAAAQWLAPGGVLAVPAGTAAAIPGFHTCLLPGSLDRVRLWAADGTELADTFAKLERRRKERAGGHTEILPDGMLETLYSLRRAEPGEELSPPPAVGRLRTRLKTSAGQPFPGVLTGILAGALVLTGFWLGRYPRYGDHFAIYARGTACMLCFLPILREAADNFRLLVDMPLPAFFGLLALALPHRTARPGVSALAAMVLVTIPALLVRYEPADATDFSRLLPAAMMGALLLFAPVFRLGTGHNGSESARYLHFCGLLTGIVLAVTMPYWYAVPVALLLFWL